MQLRLVHALALLCASLTIAVDAAGAQPDRRPNIVCILADDLGYGDLACFNSQSKIPTPRLDALASQGRRFTDAHSPSSVCSPTRYGLLTGRYAWRSRLQIGVLGAFDPPLISAELLTVPKLLQQHGYATACVGKWHLGWNWPPPKEGVRDFTQPATDGPTARGFDSYFGTDVPNYAPFCFIRDSRTVGLPTEPVPKNTPGFNRPGRMVPGWKLEEILPALAAEAVKTIEDAKSRPAQPYFLYLPLTSPHYPVVPAPEFAGKSGAGAFGDFVAQSDAVVGQVLDALERTGAAQNTLVIFTSDNGPEITGEVKPGAYDRLQQYGHASMGPLRGAKRDLWEGGHRVPFIARWPGKIAAGSQSGETICHVDLMATIAAILGAKLPEDAGVDSYNVLPALLGEPSSKPIREATVHHAASGKFAIRQGDRVLILSRSGDDNGPRGEPDFFKRQRGYVEHSAAGELYDLSTDLPEKQNIYAAEPARVAELTALLQRYIANGRSTPGPKQTNDAPVKMSKQ